MNDSKKILVVGGTGCTGGFVVKDLLKNLSTFQIDIGCRKPYSKQLEPALESVKQVKIDIRKKRSIKILSEYDLVILCIGPFEAYKNNAHKMCINAGVDCIDVNDSHNISKKIFDTNESALRNGRLVFTGMGLSPGLSTFLIDRVLKKVKKENVRLRLRLFVGGKQKSGLSAARAMMASYGKYTQELRNGKTVNVQANDCEEGERYYEFPGIENQVSTFHYTTPETWTLEYLDGIQLKDIERFDYRVHFEGVGLGMANMFRKNPLLRKPAITSQLAKIGKRMHNKEMNKQGKKAYCVMAADVQTQKERVVVYTTGVSSYEMTASFASVIAQMYLQGMFSDLKGVHCYESLSINAGLLTDLLEQRNIRLQYKEFKPVDLMKVFN